MSDEEVEPLHSPAIQSNCYFVCNINGEVSLWNMNGSLRAYTARARGAHVRDLAREDDAHIRSLMIFPSMREHAEILRRNMDAILVYAAMLGEKHSGVG